VTLHSLPTGTSTLSPLLDTRPRAAHALPHVARRAVIRPVVCACVSVTLLSGCIIWPVQQQTYPEIDGLVLAADSTPLGSAVVDRCSAATPVAVADSSGHFVLPRHTERRWITGLIGDPVYRYCVRVQAGAVTQSWTRSYIGYWPRTERLRCTLGADRLQCDARCDAQRR
jgi:hypothetical protein